ncbi:MAG: hypothetical protein AB7O57_22275 [Hyphomicrobiaceae bacterium]
MLGNEALGVKLSLGGTRRDAAPPIPDLGQFAGSGAALVLTKSTYVAPYARNAPSCLSLSRKGWFERRDRR